MLTFENPLESVPFTKNIKNCLQNVFKSAGHCRRLDPPLLPSSHFSLPSSPIPLSSSYHTPPISHPTSNMPPLPTSHFPHPTSIIIQSTSHFPFHFQHRTSHRPTSPSHFHHRTTHHLLPTPPSTSTTFGSSFFPLPTSTFPLPSAIILRHTSHFPSHFQHPTSHRLMDPTRQEVGCGLWLVSPYLTAHSPLPTSHSPLLISQGPFPTASSLPPAV